MQILGQEQQVQRSWAGVCLASLRNSKEARVAGEEERRGKGQMGSGFVAHCDACGFCDEKGKRWKTLSRGVI